MYPKELKLFVGSVLLAIALISPQRFLGKELGHPKFLKTPSGIRFSWIGEKGREPVPTLFLFAKDMQTTLERDAFGTVAWLLAKKGFIVVALDLPCHGGDEKIGEPPRLSGWAARVEKGDNLVPTFIARVSQVLDFLIQAGYSDSNRIAACGISRGGFMAIHFTAADPRVRCVATFAPVTDLTILTEFSGNRNESLARSLSVMHVADKLGGRGVWLYIGNDDERVGTDQAIAFTRLVTRRAKETKRRANVKLIVDSSEGHGLGISPHFEAAEWIANQLAEGR